MHQLKKSVEKHTEMVGNSTFIIEDSELDIGRVALDVFKGYKEIYPTPAHLARLAWLVSRIDIFYSSSHPFLLKRHLIASGKVPTGENFWDAVDRKLAELRETARKQSPENPNAYTDR